MTQTGTFVGKTDLSQLHLHK